MHGPRIVEFYDITDSRSVLSEVEKLLTKVQLAAFHRNIKRLEQHGWGLNGDYFGSVKGTTESLREYRLSLDKIDLRLLFAEEDDTFVMLAVYKEKRNDVPAGKITSAVARLKQWRTRP
jgi:hypothetical protein